MDTIQGVHGDRLAKVVNNYHGDLTICLGKGGYTYCYMLAFYVHEDYRYTSVDECTITKECQQLEFVKFFHRSIFYGRGLLPRYVRIEGTGHMIVLVKEGGQEGVLILVGTYLRICYVGDVVRYVGGYEPTLVQVNCTVQIKKYYMDNITGDVDFDIKVYVGF